MKGCVEKFVDLILWLFNVEVIGKYLFGLGGVWFMFVLSGFDSKVIGFVVIDVEVDIRFIDLLL